MKLRSKTVPCSALVGALLVGCGSSTGERPRDGGTDGDAAGTADASADAGRACQFPTFVPDPGNPLKARDDGRCDRGLAAMFGGNCENFHWLGLMGDPWVMNEGGRFRMWFTSGRRVGEAAWVGGTAYVESSDGVLWDDPKHLTEDAVHVLAPGTDGLDAHGIETPSVVRHPDTGVYYLYYTGDVSEAPSSLHVIGLATSTDGSTWTKHGTPVLAPTLPWEQPFDAGGFMVGGVLEPSVIIEGGIFKMWYQGFGRVAGSTSYARFGYAESTDGMAWTKREAPVFEGEPDTFEHLGVGHTHVVRAAGGGYHLFYAGIDASERLRLGHAHSADGLNWQRNPGNPIVSGTPGEWDEGLVGGPSAVRVGDELRLYYMGTQKADFTRPVYFAMARGRCPSP